MGTEHKSNRAGPPAAAGRISTRPPLTPLPQDTGIITAGGPQRNAKVKSAPAPHQLVCVCGFSAVVLVLAGFESLSGDGASRVPTRPGFGSKLLQKRCFVSPPAAPKGRIVEQIDSPTPRPRARRPDHPFSVIVACKLCAAKAVGFQNATEQSNAGGAYEGPNLWLVGRNPARPTRAFLSLFVH